MPTNRSRTQQERRSGGSYFRASTGISKVPDAYSRHDTIQDTVAKGDGHDLVITKLYNRGGEITYDNGANPPGVVWNKYVPDALCNRSPNGLYGHYTVPGTPTDGAAAATLVARTNPSRPVVDLPVFVAELRDLPRMMRNEGNNLRERASSANLNYHFGWAPLVSDLFKLFDFQGHCARRTTELKNLFKSGLRRKRNIFSGTMSGSDPSYTIQSFGDLWHANVQWQTQEKVWGFVEWFPTSLPPRTDAEMVSLARRAVLGLTVDLSTAWELIPFSWMADWCSSMGDYLMAQRNIVGASHGPCQIMRTKTTVGSAPEVTYQYGKRNAFVCGTITKSRKTASPSVSAYLPFLSWRQLSILGSIGLLSGRARAAR
jgi:hypothetical protein